MRQLTSLVFALLFLAPFAPLGVLASDDATATGVFSFRNGFSGIFPNTDPPIDWAADRNVVWKVPLSRRSNASPLIVGARVFTLEEPNRLLCIDKASGKILWDRTHAREDIFGAAGEAMKARRPDWLDAYGYTTPTPVSDGKRIWCVFGDGGVVCYDLNGRHEWAAKIEVDSKISGVAVSPCLVNGVLIVGGKGRERLCAFDALTGRKLWATEEGTQEGSCVPVTISGRQLVLASAGFLLEPKTGEILQRGMLGAGFKGAANRQPVNWGPTVVVENNLAFFHVHFEPDQYNAALRAVRIDPGKPPEQLWEFYTSVESNIRDRMGNSAVVDRGILYAIKDSGLLQAFDAKSGELLYAQQLPKHTYSSLALAGPYLYAFGAGYVTIFKPGRTYEQVAQFKHGFQDFVASSVFEGRRLYFRDGTGLFCIEKPAQSATGSMAKPAKSIAASDDDGPDLSDTAKDAPLLSYYEWLLKYDHTRNWVRRFSAIVEWGAALAVLLFVALKIVRVRSAPSRAWKFAFLLSVLLTLPWLGFADRFGNAYYPVLAWCLTGTLISLCYLQTPEPPRYARPRRETPPSNGVRELGWGWLLGAVVGIVVHHLPVQFILIAYVLNGWHG